MKKEKVSIITPCHNSAAFIHRLLDSILAQTFPNVQMITVDNDSKDNTATIIKSYIPRFEARGYELIYLHEDDLGPSAGVNNGMKYVTGDYMNVTDSDDWFAVEDYLERMVNLFKFLPDDYGIVRCQMQEIMEGSMEKIRVVGKGLSAEDDGKTFINCLLGANGYYYPGVGYLYKVKYLKEEIGMEIYHQYRTGQNRQLMMPLLYKYKCYTLNEPLVNYLVRPTSISHGDYGKFNVYSEVHSTFPVYISTILNSIKSMSVQERQMYFNKFMDNESRQMIKRAYDTKHTYAAGKYILDLIKYKNSSTTELYHFTKHYLKMCLVSLIKRQ